MRIDTIRPEGEHCRLPTLRDARVAFLAAQQALRRLQDFPQPLLGVATFPFVDDDGHAGIDQAIGLLEREVAALKAARQNHVAGRSLPPETETR